MWAEEVSKAVSYLLTRNYIEGDLQPKLVHRKEHANGADDVVSVVEDRFGGAPPRQMQVPA
jgi:hypothetical protein